MADRGNARLERVNYLVTIDRSTAYGGND